MNCSNNNVHFVFILTEPQALKVNGQRDCKKQVTLPSTVGVRRRYADRKSIRRSERVQDQRSICEEDPIAGLASPVHSDGRNQDQTHQRAEPETGDPIDNEEFQHSTPEPVPLKKNNQQQPSKKQAQQQSRTKTERKAERGRKPERAPLKKPWENPKPRARSKSRDRSATRAKTAACPTQGNKLNTSLGFNDTFDFDCEETVHITPFKAKTEDNQPATPISEESSHKKEASPVVFNKNELSSSSPSSESEDSLYVPQKTRRRRTSPQKTKMITTRRGRPSRVVRQKENSPPQQEISG